MILSNEGIQSALDAGDLVITPEPMPRRPSAGRDTFTQDGFDRDAEGRKYTFDYMLANPPFGVEWKQQKKFIDDEVRLYGYEGRLGAGVPRINDGSLLFLPPMLSKMRSPESERTAGIRLSATELKAIVNALGERDETAAICVDRDGNPEPDADLPDTESVPLKESIAEYFTREVLPPVPDAWIDESKTKVGYEIPLNRHLYVYEPPRPLEVIEADSKTLEGEIFALLKEVTA